MKMLKLSKKRCVQYKNYINIINKQLTFSSCFSNLCISDKCNSLNRSLTVEDWGLAVFSSVREKILHNDQ